MKRVLLPAFAMTLVSLAAPRFAAADTLTMGYLSYDVVATNSAAFDIVNETGPNSSGDATFPVTTSVGFSNLVLTVHFTGGGSEVFTSSYFTLSPDGLSYDGTPESTTLGPPGGFAGAISATLTGMFDTTTVTLYDGSTVTIGPTFTATITDPGGLADGDLGLITATTGATGITPEPESLLLVATGLGLAAGMRRRLLSSWFRKAAAASPLLLLGAFALSSSGSASATVKLNTWSAPSSGQSGLTFVSVTGSGFPSGTINPGSVTVFINTSCSTTGASTTVANQVTPVVGSSDRVQFEIPGSLATGTYFVSISGTTTGGTAFTSSNCSEVNVTAGSTTLAACVPTSSIAITVGPNVLAYVPFGYWEGGSTGIERVPIEGSGSALNYATADVVNSCASNSVTGEVVCTENNTNVDLINGATLTTLTSGSNTLAVFSGGECNNCGVAIHPGENAGVIAMGLTGGGGGPFGGFSGVQFLNLSSNTFGAPFPLANYVSENISIDANRGLILSPAENGVYDLLKIGTNNALTEYGNTIGGTLDSAAEDCTTGIALSADEFTDEIFIADLTQATFTSGAPGTWAAPGQFINLNDGGYSAGTSGVSSAPGTGHLAVVTGEFGGSAYSSLQLPATSGSGTPTLADYAYVGAMPPTPDGNVFEAGFDPHTVTAYTSPNTGKSYAVFVDYATGTPNYLGIVDLACVLTQPRSAGTHNVVGDASACTRYVAVP